MTSRSEHRARSAEDALRERVYQTPADHHHSPTVECRLPMCAVAFQRAILDYLAAASSPDPDLEAWTDDNGVSHYRPSPGPDLREALDVERLAKAMRATTAHLSSDWTHPGNAKLIAAEYAALSATQKEPAV